MTWHADHTFTVTITGGSIAGLCNALTLRSIGAAPRMAALVAETSDPFLQTIIDLTVPRTLFGRVLLIGDAAFVVRPHTAGGTAKAAHEASMLARALAGAKANVEAALRSTELLQLEYGNALFEYGLALGNRWTKKCKPV
jgi:2-polyprenyl-6-methoxyphenol hydroxylase-like FAD-dependent oxidoreductase